ncbi:dimethyladenosine transferase 2, mitochondrial [Bicyclus anynana]|uniref:rRNA adenine N(6)-methyltransferase n=1 Tax=Bicyclus anynana TaxID=110368 RepID=A0A6J1MK31_BICAN|nr:dimethyladenosine transferase 2, mitochondrial [Bicyclus anynana]
MLSTSRTLGFKPLSFKRIRFRHKVNKQHDDKPEPKAATDVMNYLENFKEYKDIVDKIPVTLLKKYKSPETMYLINKKTAKCITNTLTKYIRRESPIVEINPGFGFLTRELLACQNDPIYLYEISNHFTQFLTEIQSQYPNRIHLKSGDFFGMWKLAFQDKLDDGNRLQELLGDLATDDSDRILNIIGAMPSLTFVKHLITTIVFHNETSQLGRPDLYFAMPGHHYEFLTDSSIQMSKYKSVPALFQLLFDFKILDKVPKVHFLPWMHNQNNAKSSVIEDNCLYLVRITRKKTLPCEPRDLPLLWYFFKPHTFSKTTRVIPMLEQWIPGCGVWLITGQDPPDTNKEVGPGKDDAALPHMTIFTEFGDLTLAQKVTVFKRFISWPEFEQCPYRVTMENNLPKFALKIDEDKGHLATHLDDMESSDTEIEQ